jgi:hypothetical protein
MHWLNEGVKVDRPTFVWNNLNASFELFELEEL